MKHILFALLCCFLALSVSAQEKPLHGIDTHDLDRKANPCNDFYDFANGTWRAQNPIPASMVIWSRRWAAGEATKDVLHGILEDAAKNAATAPPKSTERLIGDYYAACMDQKAIDALGVKALAREMAWIHSGRIHRRPPAGHPETERRSDLRSIHLRLEPGSSRSEICHRRRRGADPEIARITRTRLLFQRRRQVERDAREIPGAHRCDVRTGRHRQAHRRGERENCDAHGNRLRRSLPQ